MNNKQPKVITTHSGIKIPYVTTKDAMEQKIAAANFTDAQLSSFAHELSDFMVGYIRCIETPLSQIFDDMKEHNPNVTDALIVAAAKKYPQIFSVNEDCTGITQKSAMYPEGHIANAGE